MVKELERIGLGIKAKGTILPRKGHWAGNCLQRSENQSHRRMEMEIRGPTAEILTQTEWGAVPVIYLTITQMVPPWRNLPFIYALCIAGRQS